MHIGSKNQQFDYYIKLKGGERQKLEETVCERDLGVQIMDTLKWSRQIDTITNKANAMLGWLRRAFVSRDTELWNRLYTVYVRPNLEFAVQVWNPYRAGDIKKLEKVQRRASKIPRELRNLDYQARLKRLGWSTLEQRRVRGDNLG